MTSRHHCRFGRWYLTLSLIDECFAPWFLLPPKTLGKCGGSVLHIRNIFCEPVSLACSAGVFSGYIYLLTLEAGIMEWGGGRKDGGDDLCDP